MATALHFFPYYFVHGKSMIYLGLICAINVFAGYIFTNIPLEVIAYIDAAIKLIFESICYSFQSRQSKFKAVLRHNKSGRPRTHTHPGPPLFLQSTS